MFLMPMHTHILENIHALLDFNNVSKLKSERVKYFAQVFGLSPQESENVLDGERVPNKKLLKEIADKFEVDPHWLLQN
jgi:hypothetical protein